MIRDAEAGATMSAHWAIASPRLVAGMNSIFAAPWMRFAFDSISATRSHLPSEDCCATRLTRRRPHQLRCNDNLQRFVRHLIVGANSGQSDVIGQGELEIKCYAGFGKG
jgi:hypothetical protein